MTSSAVMIAHLATYETNQSSVFREEGPDWVLQDVRLHGKQRPHQ